MRSISKPWMHLFLIFLLTDSLASIAQELPATIKLQNLVEEASARNPDLLAARLRWEASRELIPQARSLDDPELSITQWRIPSDFNLGQQGETWYGLSQTFPFPGKRSLKGEVAVEEARMADQNYQAKVREVTANVKAAYYQLFLVHKAIELHLEHQTLLEEFARIADERYAVGLVSQQDSLKAQVELSKLHNSLLILEQEKASAEAALNTLLNRPPDTALSRPEEIEYQELTKTLEELQGIALGKRPELHAAEIAIQRSEKARALAKKNYLPDLMMEVMYWDVHDGPNKWEVVTKINLPWIFKAKYDAKVRQAAAEEQLARSEYQGMRNQTLFELKDLFVKVKTSEQLIQMYQSGVLPQAEQSVEAARIGYQSGKVDFLNLIDSERTLRDFQVEYYTALAGFKQRIAELERAVGVELLFDR